MRLRVSSCQRALVGGRTSTRNLACMRSHASSVVTGLALLALTTLLGCSGLTGLGDLGGYGGDSCAESYQGKKHKCGEDCCDDDPNLPAPEPTTAPAPSSTAPKPPKPSPFADASTSD